VRCSGPNVPYAEAFGPSGLGIDVDLAELGGWPRGDFPLAELRRSGMSTIVLGQGTMAIPFLTGSLLAVSLARPRPAAVSC